MTKINKSFDKLLKENAELRKELAFYKNQIANKVKKIDVKLSHNNFYLSDDWKTIRYKKLTNHIFTKGRICECCKQVTKKLHVDHILARSIRPDLELDINNLQVLCDNCNIGKSNKDSTNWTKLNDEWDF